MMRRNMQNDRMNFILPVVAENVFTAGVSLFYSAVTGAISPGALAASSVANQAMNLIFAAFAMLSTGSAVIVARYTGRGDNAKASRTAEATIFMALFSGVLFTLLLLATSSPVMKLLMPNAESDFFKEGMKYYRLILLSVPPVIISNSAASMLRAAGNSRQVLFSNILTNAVLLFCVWLFTSVLSLDISGAALATVIARYVSAAFLLHAVIKNQRGFCVNKARIFKPELGEVKHIFRVGFPEIIGSMSVQLAYVIVNSILVSIGRNEASVVSVLNSVLILTGITQGIGSVAATTLVGHKAGAGDIAGARRTGLRILLVCEAVSMALCVPAVAFSNFSASLFAETPRIIEDSAAFMWILFPYCIVAVGVNVCEPTARVGGEIRFTMAVILICVWLIRLPLTYLLAVRLGMGYKGIYAANILSLSVRFTLSLLKITGRHWGVNEI